MQNGAIVDSGLKPPSHQTRSYCVLKIVAEQAQTAWERSGRCSNFLRSVYELNGRTRSGSDGKGPPERRPRSKISGGHAVLQLDGVTTYLERDGRTMHRTDVLRSSYGRDAVGHYLAVRLHTDLVEMLVTILVMMMTTTCTAGSVERK